MRLFRRGPRTRFPADLAAWLETFGRCRLGQTTSRVGGASLWERLGPLYDGAKADRDGFLVDLAALVEGDRAGFATLGAARVVWEIFGEDAPHIPAALSLIDAGIAMKTARGLPGLAFTGYEMRRVRTLREQA